MLIRRAVSFFSRTNAPVILKSSVRNITHFAKSVAKTSIRFNDFDISRSSIIRPVALPNARQFLKSALLTTPKLVSKCEAISTVSAMSPCSNIVSKKIEQKKIKKKLPSSTTMLLTYSTKPTDRQPIRIAEIYGATEVSSGDSENSSNPSSPLRLALLVGYPFSMLILLLLGCVFVTKSFDSGEKEIKHNPMDLKSNNHHGYIVDAKDFIVTGTKIKGELSGCVVEDSKTGSRYLKKGARSLNALIKEFLISNFLYMLRPEEQPNSLLMEEIQPDGSARFYTLSRISPNSMDLEDFISRTNWRENLSKKPLLGFEVAMAADLLFAKQQDMKFANYIVIEKENCYIVACIDHEKSGQSVVHKTTFVDNIDEDFLSHIVDLNDKGQEYRVGLYNNPDAREFIKVAQKFMKMENIQEFYKQVAFANPQKIVHLVRDIDGKDSIIDEINGHKYMKELLSICEQAAIVSFQADGIEDKPLINRPLSP